MSVRDSINWDYSRYKIDMEVVFLLDSRRTDDNGAAKPQVDRHENRSCFGLVGEMQFVLSASTWGFLGGVLLPCQ